LDNIDAETDKILLKNEESIADLNRQQLLDGKGSDGLDLHPFYSEDPYFKSKESAARYAAFKQRITPNKNRNPDAPNLFINGKLHGTIKLFVSDSRAIFRTEGSIFDVEAKYPKALGLDEEKTKFLNYDIVKPELDNFIKKYL